MKKSILSTLFLTGLFVFAVIPLKPNIVLAQEEIVQEETGSVKVKSVEIKDVKITAQDDKLEIFAVLFNPSQNVKTAPFASLVFLQTVDPLIRPKQNNLILPPLHVAANEDKEYFQLKPKEEKLLNTFLPISPFLPKSNYEFYLKLIKSNGEEVDSYRQIIYNLGANKKTDNLYKESFLAFDQQTCMLIASNGKKSSANVGPIFQPMESPKASCLVKNVSDKEINVSPVVEWKEFFVFGRPSSGTAKTEKINQIIAFKSGETKTVEVSLPKTDKPQVYQALLNFSDKNDNIVSYAMSFRWTIGGPSARIDKIIIDKNSLKRTYKKGDAISLSIDYFGSMDLFWGKSGAPLSDVKISANIKDDKGNVCGTNEVKAADVTDPGSHNQIVSVVLNNDCKNISYEAFLFSAGQKLASEADNLPKLIGADDKEKSGDTSPFYYYIIGGLILLIIYKIVVIVNRRKHKDDWQKNILIFVIAATSVLFFGWSGSAQAETLTITPNNPALGTIQTCLRPGLTDCQIGLSRVFNKNQNITIIATPVNSGGYYVDKDNWGAGCNDGKTYNDVTGEGRCKATMNNDKIISVIFSLSPELTIEKTGNGTGTVEGCVVGGACYSSFPMRFPKSAEVNLTATPDSPHRVTDMGGGCNRGEIYKLDGSGVCKLTMNGDKTIQFKFADKALIKTVIKAGQGKITSDEGGIDCGLTCSKEYPFNSNIMLTATPVLALGYGFAGWSGSGCGITDVACWTSETASITVGQRDKIILASFSETKRYFGSAWSLPSLGGESSSPSGVLKSWAQIRDLITGVYVNATNTIKITSIKANFNNFSAPFIELSYDQQAVGCGNHPSMRFKIRVANGADGKPELPIKTRKQGSPTPFIDIINDPVVDGYASNSGIKEIFLDIDPASILNFYGSPLAPNPYLAIYITELGIDDATKNTYFTRGYFTDEDQVDYFSDAKAFVASDVIKYKIPLSLPTYIPKTLSVTSSNGTVTGPSGLGDGISCGANCSEAYSDGATSVLTVVANGGYTFSGWTVAGGGSCSGLGNCTVTMDADKTVTANFTLIPSTKTLSVTSSNGTVTGPSGLGDGISCGANCSEAYSDGATSVLTVVANGGYTFSGWTVAGGGSCSGLGNCTVTMDADKTVTANFSLSASLPTTSNWWDLFNNIWREQK